LKRLWNDVRQTGDGSVDDSLFDLKADFDILEGIKDIMEELSMLSHVEQQQKRALRSLDREEFSPQAAGILDKSSHHGGSDTSKPFEVRQLEGPIVKFPPRRASSPSSPSRQIFRLPKGSLLRDEHSGHETSGLERSPSLLELLQRADERDLEFRSLVNKATATYKAVSSLRDISQCMS
jgi:hypothetical protein